jgi:hypothetical protein
MADTEFDEELGRAHRRARHSAHVYRAQTMLTAAGLATLGIVAVAGAMLTTLF